MSRYYFEYKPEGLALRKHGEAEADSIHTTFKGEDLLAFDQNIRHLQRMQTVILNVMSEVFMKGVQAASKARDEPKNVEAAPAFAVEEVELTRQQAKTLCLKIEHTMASKEPQVVTEYLASLGLRIVRDAKPVASFGRRTPPLNLPDDDGFCSVGGLAVDLGLYKSSDAKPVPADDAAKRDEKDTAIAELAKRVDALEVNQGLTKSMNAELMKRVDAIGNGQRKADELITEMRNQINDLSGRIVDLEDDNPEPKTATAKRAFTESQILDAMAYADERSLSAEVYASCFASRLGIKLEATK